MKKNELKVTLMRSLYGRKKGHKETVYGLGLRRIRHSVVVSDDPCIRGMIDKINYLLHVEKI